MNRTTKHTGALPLLACAAAAALLAGCATSGYEQADKTGETIDAFRVAVVQAKAAVDEVFEKLLVAEKSVSAKTTLRDLIDRLEPTAA